MLYVCAVVFVLSCVAFVDVDIVMVLVLFCAVLVYCDVMCFVSVMLCCVVLWCCCVGVVFMYYDIVLVLYWIKVKSGQKQPVAQSSLMRGPWEKQ